MNKIFFLHIPKTGGSSINAVFANQFDDGCYQEPVEVSLESWIARKVRKAGIQIHIIGIIVLIFALSWRCRFIWIHYDS